jgi:hypothetical protein
MIRAPRQIGIAFSTEMIDEILDDRKTETRRIATDAGPLAKAEPGDLLWVKEGFEVLEWFPAERKARIRYLTHSAVGGHLVAGPERLKMGKLGLKLPRFMPREASRIDLNLSGRRREPLLHVDDAGAIAEGVSIDTPLAHEIHPSDPLWKEGALRMRYLALWDKINGPRGYGSHSNPDVDVFRFERLRAA